MKQNRSHKRLRLRKLDNLLNARQKSIPFQFTKNFILSLAMAQAMYLFDGFWRKVLRAIFQNV